MRVAIVGAGSLGCVYAARLSAAGSCSIHPVGRSAAKSRMVRVERVEDGAPLDWVMPPCAARVPRDADVVLVCVRYDQLDAVAELVEDVTAPVVVFTPIMPGDHARLCEKLGPRLVVGMPSIAAYDSAPGVIRYWLPRSATTLIEEGTSGSPQSALVDRLRRAGISARLERNVLERNVATTVSLVPIAMALDVANGVEPLLSNAQLLNLTVRAAREGTALGGLVGRPAPWVATIMRFIGPLALQVALRALRARVPEVIHYAESHFVRKLRRQNLLMADAICDLAQQVGAKSTALQSLRLRLRAVASTSPSRF